ncbi:MAG: DNA repair protein RecO [Bacteroidia bacterium]|nr:DNA repair protein RecO [Bacteroidia bacterium]
MKPITTRGIVLRLIKYSETSVILNVYTEEAGLQSYILRGIRKKNNKTGMAVVQPMTLVELLSTVSVKSSLHPIREIRPLSVYESIPYNPVKSSVLFFLNEILCQVLMEESENRPLFSFLFYSMEFFDQYEGPLANFHLLFLLQLSRYLGIFPQNNYHPDCPYFDRIQGCFSPYKNSALTDADTEDSGKWLSQLLQTPYDKLSTLRVPYNTRLALNAHIIAYYQYHIPGFREIKSLEVIQMVLND